MRTVLSLLAVLLAAWPAAAQAPAGYLDMFVVKVRPEKRAEFEAATKKMVDANRRHNGDTWLASETAYGESNTVYFTSLRANMAEAEKGSELFMGALTKAYGAAGANRLLGDFNGSISSSRGELRRRRPELSSNLGDAAAMNKIIGESRWTRIFTIRVRPGRTLDYEGLLRENKAARDRSSDQSVVSVTQGAGGQVGTVFYITTLKSSLGGFDSMSSLQQLLGNEGYQRYQKASADIVLGIESTINRFVPELSNPPADIVAAAPTFWKPKPPPPPPPPPKPVTGGAAKN